MPSVSLPTAVLIAGGATAAGAVASSAIGAGAAKSAAKTQATAASAAEAQQLAEFNDTKKSVQPFIDAGTGALPQLEGFASTGLSAGPQVQNLLGLGGPGAPDTTAMQKALEATPGYQFTKQQGLESVENSYAAQGLASSGSALKGAGQFVTGLADQTYQSQLNNYLQLYQSGGAAAAGLVSNGGNAALALGQQGITATNVAGNFGTSGAAATAAGTVGAANALSAGISGFTNSLGQTGLLSALTGSGGTASIFGPNSESGSAISNANTAASGNELGILNPAALPPTIFNPSTNALALQ